MFSWTVSSTEGRPRGRATMGRDAVPAGEIRTLVPGRSPEQRSGEGPIRPVSRERQIARIPLGAPRGETHRSQDASPGKRKSGSPERTYSGGPAKEPRSRVFSARHSPRLGEGKKRRATPRPHQLRGRFRLAV